MCPSFASTQPSELNLGLHPAVTCKKKKTPRAFLFSSLSLFFSRCLPPVYATQQAPEVEDVFLTGLSCPSGSCVGACVPAIDGNKALNRDLEASAGSLTEEQHVNFRSTGTKASEEAKGGVNEPADMPRLEAVKEGLEGKEAVASFSTWSHTVQPFTAWKCSACSARREESEGAAIRFPFNVERGTKEGGGV